MFSLTPILLLSSANAISHQDHADNGLGVEIDGTGHVSPLPPLFIETESEDHHHEHHGEEDHVHEDDHDDHDHEDYHEEDYDEDEEDIETDADGATVGEIKQENGHVKITKPRSLLRNDDSAPYKPNYKLLHRDKSEPYKPGYKMLKREKSEPWKPGYKMLKRERSEPWKPGYKLLHREKSEPWKPSGKLLRKPEKVVDEEEKEVGIFF